MSDDARIGTSSRRVWGQNVAGALVASGVVHAIGSPCFGKSPAIRTSTPVITHGIGSGDVSRSSAVVWSRADRVSRMVVEYATNDRFTDARRVVGPIATPDSDFTSKAILNGLPPGQTIVYRVAFQDVDKPSNVGEPRIGRFRTASNDRKNLSFVWGGDVSGQGWGIDPVHGGMATFESMRQVSPDFFLHSGDHVYADNPILPEVQLADGSTWKNLVTPETSKVAETLDEFRGRYRYNRMDEAFRQFAAEVPVLAQWDDHEVRNNWYPGQTLGDDPRYTVKDVDLLAARGRRAFLDHMPIVPKVGGDTIYRVVSQGPLVDVFLLDERTYRGPNSANRQAEASPATAFLGPDQLAWLKKELKASRAVWKVIASDMPLGLVIGDGPKAFEAVANGDGPALGRELEIADLLSFVKREAIPNLVWFTADVHYAAAHRYDPAKARFTDFEPFWEFVAGPLHAGNFGPGVLDDTFGPQLEFASVPPGTRANQPPSSGLQFFGVVKVEGASGVMTVSLHDRAGKSLYSRELIPA